MRLREGELIPKGYGLAYIDFSTMFSIYYPIPLNLIVRLFRGFYFWVMKGCWKCKYERKLKEIYQNGRRDAHILMLREAKLKYLLRGLEMSGKGLGKTNEEIDKLWEEALED